uniref:Uncharacterized protein n=1 Tax=Anguilla anguilla TaxID=7936 RepID=A0A0E9VGY7_ANGAN
MSVYSAGNGTLCQIIHTGEKPKRNVFILGCVFQKQCFLINK